MSNEIKVGVRRGSGPPPGYLWTVFLLDFVHDEAMKFLTPAQYEHVSGLVRELATSDDPTHPVGLSVSSIEDFHELRDRAGVLGGLNVRVFFYFDKQIAAIVVLGAIAKQNNGKTPVGDRIRMQRRKRKYVSGDYGNAEKLS